MSRDLELEKQIDAYLKGHLSEEEAHQLWEKLLLRPDYIELLETELGIKSILENRSTGDQKAARGNTVIYSIQRSWKWMAAAASIAILVVAINFFQVNTEQSIRDAAQKSFNLTEHLSSAQILRDQKNDISPSDSLLNRGFEAAISGEVSNSLAIYDQIIEQYSTEPAAIQAHLNKGLIQYNKAQFEEAAQSFNAVIDAVEDRAILEEKAHWYLGNVYVNLGKFEEARTAIQKAYAMDGIYRKPASRLLKKLDYELGNISSDEFDQEMEEGQ